MATRKAPPPQPQPANLTAEQIRAAIPKLERRIAELESFDPDSIRDRSDPRLNSIESKLEDTITEVFGTDTQEARRFRPRRLDEAPMDQAGFNMVYETLIHQVISSVQRTKERELANLRTIIEVFNEKLADRLCFGKVISVPQKLVIDW